VQWEGNLYEVPYQYAGKTLILVVDPHAQKALHIESEEGNHLGAVTLLDRQANAHRNRQRPTTLDHPEQHQKLSAVEMLYDEHQRALGLPAEGAHNTNKDKENN